jgi:hypothetical protein
MLVDWGVPMVGLLDLRPAEKFGVKTPDTGARGTASRP